VILTFPLYMENARPMSTIVGFTTYKLNNFPNSNFVTSYVIPEFSL